MGLGSEIGYTGQSHPCSNPNPPPILPINSSLPLELPPASLSNFQLRPALANRNLPAPSTALALLSLCTFVHWLSVPLSSCKHALCAVATLGSQHKDLYWFRAVLGEHYLSLPLLICNMGIAIKLIIGKFILVAQEAFADNFSKIQKCSHLPHIRSEIERIWPQSKYEFWP